jgi:hypothetical protein
MSEQLFSAILRWCDLGRFEDMCVQSVYRT